MRKIRVTASGEYEVAVGQGLLCEAGETLAPILRGRRVMIVSDSHVYPLWGETLRASLSRADLSCESFVFPAGERSKNPETYLALLRKLAGERFTRDDAIFALGGGVVGDLAGFAAATYLRGVDYVQLPTSVLAAVDSSVGGKTAVDLPEGKNLVGAFHQPRAVLTDLSTFATLPPDIAREGFAEVIKCGILSGEELFSLLEEKGSPDVRDSSWVEEVIARCVTLKRDIVERDEFDRGDRALLNLGHTMAHSVEALSGYTIPHGAAVAMGTAAIADASARAGFCTEKTAARIRALLLSFGFTLDLPYPLPALIEEMAHDKKRAGEEITLVIPADIGDCRLLRIPTSDLPRFFGGE